MSEYRFHLYRNVNPMFGEHTVLFCMLNPSTATDTKDDATIKRCISYAKQWGYGRLSVVNLSPLRATQPADLLKAGPEPADIWERNIEAIRSEASRAEMVVAAWGADGKAEGRDRKVLALLDAMHKWPYCLNLTKDGLPRHPLYQPDGLVPFRLPRT